MIVAVVDLPEAVDVDECQHEPPVATAGAIDLALEGLLPRSPPECPSELIEVGPTQLRDDAVALLRSAFAIRGCLGAILRRPGPVPARLRPDLRSMRESGAQWRATGRHLPLELRRVIVASLGSAVPRLCGQIAVPCV